MKKNIVIDDFGRTPQVSKTILKVIKDIPNINEVSVMMDFVNPSFHNKLRLIKIKKSLHLNLTDNIHIENIGKNLSFLKLVFLSKKKKVFVYNEINSQIKKFQKLYKLTQISINGHEHVHTIPWIYKYLYNNKDVKSIRYVNEKFLFVFKKIKFFDLIRNCFSYSVVKIFNLLNKKKNNKLFFGLFYTNNMCRKVYNKIIKNYSNSNLEILFHPGSANENEIDYFSNKIYYNYFVSNSRSNELKELYEIKKNFNNYR